jgi:hypothetical protein
MTSSEVGVYHRENPKLAIEIFPSPVLDVLVQILSHETNSMHTRLVVFLSWIREELGQNSPCISAVDKDSVRYITKETDASTILFHSVLHHRLLRHCRWRIRQRQMRDHRRRHGRIMHRHLFIMILLYERRDFGSGTETHNTFFSLIYSQSRPTVRL